MITGQEKSPIEIGCGVVIQRHDIATTQEEADNIIVQQAIQVAVNEQKHVTTGGDPGGFHGTPLLKEPLLLEIL